MGQQPTLRTLIFTGDGKGKTTAAFGMAFRALGHRYRVRVVQFIKTDTQTGESLFSRNNSILEIDQVGIGFVPKRSHPKFDQHVDAAASGLQIAQRALTSDETDLVILDEICTAVHLALLQESDVIDVIKTAVPPKIIVLTGRGATPKLMDIADTVTEMKCIKHAYQSGVKAQQGVEF